MKNLKLELETAVNEVTEKEFTNAIENDTCEFGNRIADILNNYVFKTAVLEEEFEEKLFLNAIEETVEETKENILDNLDDLDLNEYILIKKEV